VPRKFIRRPAWLLALALMVGLFAGCSVFSKEREATVGATNVSAKVTHGKLVGQPLPPSDPGNDVTTIGEPIHLAVDGGELKGDATLRTPVPENLPKGVKPEDVGYLTKHEPSGIWFWMGGDYDPATKTVVLQTPHFSDWVVGYTDPAKLLADMEDFDYRSVVSKSLIETMYGSLAKLKCSRNGKLPKGLEDIQTLVDVKIDDPDKGLGDESVKACMGIDEKTGDYDLEILNPHMFPLRLKLPDGVTVKRELTGDEGLLHQAYALAQYQMQGDAVLFMQGKIHLIVKPEKLTSDSVITAKLDYETFVFNTAMWLTELLISPRSIDEALGGKSPQTKAELVKHYAEIIKDYTDYANCINGTVGERIRDGKTSVKDMVFKVLDKCLTSVTHLVADGISTIFKLRPNNILKATQKYWTSRIEILKSSMTEGREIMGTTFKVLEQLGVGYEVKILPTRDVHIEQALPAPYEADFKQPKYMVDLQGNPLTDPRQLVSAVDLDPESGFLVPDCTHGVAFSVNWVKGGRAGFSEYQITDDESHLHESWFAILPIKPEYAATVVKYIAKGKRDCLWDPAHPQSGTLAIRNTTTLGRAVVSYDIETGTDSFVRNLSYSNGFLLVGTVGSGDDNELRDKAMDRAFRFAALKADSTFIGTTFGSRQ
jgi:hypothetical protein